MAVYQPRDWRETKPGWLLLEERQFDPKTGRNVAHIVLAGPDGERRTYVIDIRMYTYTELAALMAQAGLTPTAAYGSFDKTEYTRESHRMIVVAEKVGGA
jgi:hypothetical protein